MDASALLREFIAIPGPAGQEERIRSAFEKHVLALGYQTATDAKGNLMAFMPAVSEMPRIVVTAHLDEIALMVTRVEPDGSLSVKALGGIHPWKLGEGPVSILARDGDLTGVLSFGSIHTASAGATVRRVDTSPLSWEMASVFTGLDYESLMRAGVHPGTRVVVPASRRGLTTMGEHVAGYFLDDRADLVAMLLAMEAVRGLGLDVLFVATAAEEVGGEGALYVLQDIRPEVCIALELGPSVPDAPVEISAAPTVWVTDSYSSTSASDLDLVQGTAETLGIEVQFQALSRGGSDASCAASHGHCARPFTLGLPMENSHGYEIMHRDAPIELAKLTAALLIRIAAEVKD